MALGPQTLCYRQNSEDWTHSSLQKGEEAARRQPLKGWDGIRGRGHQGLLKYITKGRDSPAYNRGSFVAIRVPSVLPTILG